ncbi:hypothetical protein DPEC_G00362330 [Dallia pectoralis]|nr:hypothetical protein DPEC_G00362330 [Dallia pectoralis]
MRGEPTLKRSDAKKRRRKMGQLKAARCALHASGKAMRSVRPAHQPPAMRHEENTDGRGCVLRRAAAASSRGPTWELITLFKHCNEAFVSSPACGPPRHFIGVLSIYDCFEEK